MMSAGVPGPEPSANSLGSTPIAEATSSSVACG